MKNIKVYEDEKYADPKYKKAAEHIYCTDSEYVTSLRFEQEPERDEGSSPQDISQYPLEDILDTYNVWVSDFYEEKNAASTDVCYQEFCSSDITNIQKLLGIAGKHVYDKEIKSGDGQSHVELAVE